MPKVSPCVAHLLDLLEPWAEVRARRMFGGYGLFREGLMFALVADEVPYVKVDDLHRSTFEQEGLEAFVYEMKNGRSGSLSYYGIPEEALDRSERLRPWVERAWDAATRADAEKPPSKRKRRAA